MQIHRTMIEVDSKWGVSTHNEYLTHAADSSCLAVFFPGKDHTCDVPLLHYARKAVMLAGCDTLSLEYGYYIAQTQLAYGETGDLAAEALTAIRRALRASHRALLFVSKSLGTLVAGEVAARFSTLPVRHLFLTPLAAALPYLKQSRGVLLTGTSDKHFGQEYVRQIHGVQDLEVVEIPGAVHSLELEEDLAGSLRILQSVCDRCSSLARDTLTDA